MRRYLLLCLLLLPLFASPQQTRIEEQTITHTQAQQWGLTDSEWQHYQQLRQGERGIWSPGLDPLTTLGVAANSDAERQRYAELLARKEHQRVEKELAFQRAYDQAWKRLYPTLTPIRSVVQPRLALFVSEKCPACETLAQKLINDDRPLDIWLVNSRNDDASLQRWAQRQHIDMRKVERGQITLNHDNGRWQRLGGGKLPLLLEQQGGAMASRLCALTVGLLISAHACAVPPLYAQIARQQQVPAELLYAVARAESGSRLAQGLHPWPWTLNIAGTGYRYPSRSSACRALLTFARTRSLKRIDAGLGQINLGWNGQWFPSLCASFDPTDNLTVTALLLRQHYNASPGSWLDAAARYHHPARGKSAAVYRQKISQQIRLLSASGTSP